MTLRLYHTITVLASMTALILKKFLVHVQSGHDQSIVTYHDKKFNFLKTYPAGQGLVMAELDTKASRPEFFPY
jgi:hypothetical protein